MAASEFEAYMESLIAAMRETVSADALAGELHRPYGSPVFRAPAWDDVRDVNRALREAAEALPELEDPFNACRLAYVIGVLIENGGDADHLALDLTRLLATSLEKYRPLQEAVDPEGEGIDEPLEYIDAHPEAVRVLLGLRDLSLAVMTALCRAKKSRIEVKGWASFRKDLEQLAFPNGWYIRELLACVDDLALEVIHVEQKRGFHVVAHTIRNNFQLFSLLQAELIGDVREGLLEGPDLDPGLVAYARGETHQRPSDSDWAVWHFGNHTAWTGAGFCNDIKRTSIWGEQSPSEIPQFEERRIVLLGPSALKSKSWDANFIASLHDAHKPSLWVTLMTKGEVERTLASLAEGNSA